LPYRVGIQPGPAHPEDLVRVRIVAEKSGAPVISDGATFNFLLGHTERLDFVLTRSCLASDCAKMDQACISAGLCDTVTPQPYYTGNTRDGGSEGIGVITTRRQVAGEADVRLFSGGASRIWALSYGGFLLHSDDLGTTWTPETPPYDLQRTALWAAGPDDVYCAFGNQIARRLNGSWSLEATPANALIATITGTPTAIYAASWDDSQVDGLLRKDPQSGGWSIVRGIPRHLYYLTSIAAAANNIAVVDSGGFFAYSTDFATWTQAPSDSQAVFTAVWAVGSAAFAVGRRSSGGVIAWTLDAGQTWKQTYSAAALNGVWAASVDDVYAVGQSGTLLHSRDRGASWPKEDTKTTTTLSSVWGVDGAHVFIGGLGGLILERQ
jgi:hypothetical protein